MLTSLCLPRLPLCGPSAPSPLLSPSGSPPLRLCLSPVPVCLRVSVSFFLCLQVGWRRKPTTDLTPPTSPISSLPPPSPGQPPPVPPFCILGEGPSLTAAPPWPSLPQLISCLPSSSPLAGFSPRPPGPPLPPLSFLCVYSSLLLAPSSPPPPSPLPGLFFTPPHPRLMPSLVLDNYQIYQWGERSVCCACVLAAGCGRALAPAAG